MQPSRISTSFGWIVKKKSRGIYDLRIWSTFGKREKGLWPVICDNNFCLVWLNSDLSFCQTWEYILHRKLCPLQNVVGFSWSMHHLLRQTPVVVHDKLGSKSNWTFSSIPGTPEKFIVNFEAQTLFKLSFLFVVVKGHQNQRGSAPGHGASRFTDHSRDFHRAWEAKERRSVTCEVGSPGSGTDSVFH